MQSKTSIIQKAVVCGLCAAFIGGVAVPSSTVFAASKADKAQAKELYKNAFSSYKNGNFIAAADGFISANKLDEENPLFALSAGDMLCRLKQYESSIMYYKKAADNLKHAPKGTKDRATLQTYEGLSKAYLESGDKQKAIEAAEEVTKRFKKKYNGYYMLGKIYASDHLDDTKAIENFNKALDIDDTQLPVYASLSDLYKQKNDMVGMESTLKRGCLARPLDETMKVALGRLYLEWDDNGKTHYDKAEQVFKDLIGLDEKSAWGHYYLGESYLLQGKFDQASNELSLLSSLNGNLANRLQKEMWERADAQSSETTIMVNQ